MHPETTVIKYGRSTSWIEFRGQTDYLTNKFRLKY